MPRLFIAIKIPDAGVIANTQNNLKGILSKSKINWVDPESFHLTLKFLGDVDSHLINPIIQILEHITHTFKKIILKNHGLGIYGTINKPHVIWYGFKENLLLTDMQSTIEKSLTELGFAEEERKFSAHLTLARIKVLEEKKELISILKSEETVKHEFEIDEFQLIKSELTQKGPIYTIVKSFLLNSQLNQ